VKKGMNVKEAQKYEKKKDEKININSKSQEK
jgi:hypothetical protein